MFETLSFPVRDGDNVRTVEMAIAQNGGILLHGRRWDVVSFENGVCTVRRSVDPMYEAGLTLAAVGGR